MYIHTSNLESQGVFMYFTIYYGDFPFLFI